MEKTDFRYCPSCNSEYEPNVEFCSDCNITLIEEQTLDGPLEKIEWVEAGQFSGKVWGEMAGEILGNNDIPYFLKSDFFSTAYNISAVNMPGGLVKLFVPAINKEQAEQLIMDVAD